MKVLLIVCMQCLLVLCVGDQIFDAKGSTQNISEWQEEMKAFELFEKKVVSFMENMRRKILPFLAKAAIQITLSPACSSSLMRLYADILSFKSWAIRLLDSSGKPPGGVLRGTTMMLGDYEECINIGEQEDQQRGKPIMGKYCLTHLYGPKMLLRQLQKYSAGELHNASSSMERFKDFLNLMSKYKLNATAMHFRVGICIPSTCSEVDLYNMLDYGMNKSGIRSEIRRCEMKDEMVVETHQIPIIVAFGLVAIAVILGSFLECCFDDTSYSRNAIIHFLLFFSICRNARNLFKDKQKNHDLTCLRGLTVIAYIYMTVGQCYTFFDQHWFFNFRSTMNYFDFIKDPFFAMLANSACIIETFFCIAGFLLYYKQSSVVDVIGINIRTLIVGICSQCLLPLLVAISVFLLLPLLGNGPVWHEIMDSPMAACRKNWWRNLLLINNFLNVNDQCLVQTSFIGCIAQLIVIGVLFRILINRWPRLGITCLLLTVAVSNAFTGIVTVAKSLPPSLSTYYIFKRSLVKRILENYYFFPYAHMGPFAIGFLVAYRVKNYPEEKLKRMTSILFWVCMLVLWGLLVFGLYPNHDGSKMNIVASVFYSSLHSTTFGAVIGMAIFVCIRGHGGFIGKMLSSKIFILPWNLFYPAYLMHSIVMLFFIGISRERSYFGHYETFSKSFGNLSTIFLTAFVFHLFFGGIFAFVDSFAQRNPEQILEQGKSQNMVQNSKCFSIGFKSKKFRVKPSTIKVYDVTRETSFSTSLH